MNPDWALLTKLTQPEHITGGLGPAYQGFRLDCDSHVMPLQGGSYNLFAMPPHLGKSAMGVLFTDASQAGIDEILTFKNSLVVTDTGRDNQQTSTHDIDIICLNGGLFLVRPSNSNEAMPSGKVRSITFGDHKASTSQAWAGLHMNEMAAPVLSLPLGTVIETSRGELAVEQLRSNDSIITIAGPIPVKMISMKRIDGDRSKNGDAVITIAEASLIGAKPDRDVSLFSHTRFRSAADIDGKFSIAGQLTDNSPSPSPQMHVHALLAEAGVIEISGLHLLTLLPAKMALDAFADEARSTLIQCFPALGEGINASQMPLARKVISDEMAQKLIAAHLAANKSFFEED